MDFDYRLRQIYWMSRLETHALLLAAALSASLAQAADLPNFGAIAQSKSSIRLSGTIQPSSSIGIYQESLSADLLAWKNETDRIFVNAKASSLGVGSTDPLLPNLYDASLGGTFVHELSREPGSESVIGASASFGSASDHPFREWNVDTLSVTGFYSVSDGPKSKWILLLNYSNNRPLLNNIPLPGFVYLYTPSPTLRVMAGAPFGSLYWEFADRWSYNFFTLVPSLVKTSFAYRVYGPVQLFAGFDFSQQTYLRFGRTNLDERTFYDEKRATVGARSPLSASLFAELETGVAFSRRFFDAESYAKSKSRETPLEAGWLAHLSLNLGF